MRLAQERLDEASGAIETQMDFVRSELTEEENLSGDFTGQLIRKMLKAERTVRNTETQFLNYQIDLREAREDEKPLRDIPETYDLMPTAAEYKRTYEAARRMVDRYEILERRFQALSQIMEQNDLGSPVERRSAEHDWYEEDEYDADFQTAAQLT